MLTAEARTKLRSLPPPTVTQISVPMIQRSALLLDYDPKTGRGCAEGHRGWWAYSRSIYGDLKAGQRVDFVSAGEVILRAVVTAVAGADCELIKALHGVSGVNGTVFTWEEAA